jgi:hypothetical protein
MQPNSRKSLVWPTARFVTAMYMLAFSAGALIAPPEGISQNVPPVGDPSTQCPHCKAWVVCRGAKVPDVCPHCHQPMFAQPVKPAPVFGPLQNPALPAFGTVQPSPKLQTINPFGDYLFYGVPIRPDDGKLQTRHFDPDGLPAQAEEWGRQMKQNQDVQTRAFEHDKQKALNGLDAAHSGPAMQQLKNIYAGGEDGWNNPKKSGAASDVPRFPDNTVIKALRDPDADGGPIDEKKKLSDRPIESLTDTELAQRSAENAKEIQKNVTLARHDLDTSQREQKVWNGVGNDLAEGQNGLVKATGDALQWGYFSGADKTLPAGEVLANGFKATDKSISVIKGWPDLCAAAQEGNGLKTVGAAGDLAVTLLPDKYLPPAVSDYYSTAKFGIEYTAAMWNLGINGSLISEFDARNTQRSFDTYLRGEKLKQLEEDQKRIQAEKDRRNRMNGAVSPSE